eukprot:194972_1
MRPINSSPLICIVLCIYIEYLWLGNGQHEPGSEDQPNPYNDDFNEPNPPTEVKQEYGEGHTSIMGFLVIIICCLFGCCLNVCLRSSRRHRQPRIRRIAVDPNALQLFSINNEADAFEECSVEEGSCNDKKGVLVNLDEYKEVEHTEDTRIDIETIKREGTMCVICYEPLAGNVRILDCDHMFCETCIVQWEKEGKCLCPICRQPTCSKKYMKKKEEILIKYTHCMDDTKQKRIQSWPPCVQN